MVNEMIESLRAQLEKARAEVEAWRGRFKALVGEDRPDMAGNVVIRLQSEVALGLRRTEHALAIVGDQLDWEKQTREQAEARLAKVIEAAAEVIADSEDGPINAGLNSVQALRAALSAAKEKPKA